MITSYGSSIKVNPSSPTINGNLVVSTIMTDFLTVNSTIIVSSSSISSHHIRLNELTNNKIRSISSISSYTSEVSYEGSFSCNSSLENTHISCGSCIS